MLRLVRSYVLPNRLRADLSLPTAINGRFGKWWNVGLHLALALTLSFRQWVV